MGKPRQIRRPGPGPHLAPPARPSRLDRAVFLRPIAHRGLHAAESGIVENTEPAFVAAIAAGHGIECDLRPGAAGLPLVFHDDTLDRLIDGSGPIARIAASALRRLRYRNADTRILTFAELLELVGGRVPLLVEVKSEWQVPIDLPFLTRIARLVADYRGPLALMSFDPTVMMAFSHLVHETPRGLVSGLYQREPDDDWWSDKLSPERASALSNLLESVDVAPDFVAYHVKALPTPVLRYAREVQGLPVFTWTVRSAEDAATALKFADAPIFEGPAMRRHYAKPA